VTLVVICRNFAKLVDRPERARTVDNVNTKTGHN